MHAVDPGKGDVVVAIDRQGRATELVLGKRLGGGGEGTVFKVAQPPSFQGQAVKIFNEETRPSKMPKVRAMLGLDPEPNTTWPLAVVHRDHRDGEEIGYGMPLAPGEMLLDATNPALRRRVNADLDFFSFHWLAENLAKTVGRLHAHGHVIGDLKDINTTFDPETLEVFLIDTDSFGIAVNDAGGGFPAKIATPDWSPPESSGASALGVAHDLFALAILYHWLLFATHPFSGTATRNTYDDPTVNAIKEGRWIYRRNAIPPPRVPPFSVISPGLQELFGCAFESGLSNPALRPAAAAWEAAFRDARYDLTWCGKHPLHVFDRRAGACPWCRLKPERWPTRHSPRSRTIGVAQMELRALAMPAHASEDDLEHAERRLAANPAWARDLPEVADRLRRFRLGGEKEETDATAQCQLPFLVEPIRPQGPGPKYCINEDGLIDNLDDIEVDDFGNNTKLINQLRPLILRCVAELRVELNSDKFPKLAAYILLYRDALEPEEGEVQWESVWDCGVILERAANAAQSRKEDPKARSLEDPAKSTLASLLTLHRKMLLATVDGARLFEMPEQGPLNAEQLTELHAAAEERRTENITPDASEKVDRAAHAVGDRGYPEPTSIYDLASRKNVSIVLISVAAAATPPLLGAFFGGHIGVALGTPFSYVTLKAMESNPVFKAIMTQIGTKLTNIPNDSKFRVWLEELARRCAPFRSFVIAKKEPLREIAATTPELKCLLRYIEFITRENDGKSSDRRPDA